MEGTLTGNGVGVSKSMGGHLLLASPQLTGYFQRAVVLVLEHEPDGAMGVVLNRPTDTPVLDAVPDLADLAEYGDVVYAGGPVEPEGVIALGDFEQPEQAGALVMGSVGLIDPDAPDPDLRRMRVFAGYAGWAPEQLDAELEADGWIVAQAELEDPFSDGDLWPEVLERKGGSYALLAKMPADPSLN
jgi:putative transcriptional regulator